MQFVLIRHGESTWNRENRFTGWTDVDLSEQGRREAERAGDTLREKGFAFDCAFSSVLKRAIRTLWTVLDRMDRMWLPTVYSWKLNERHYGALQGLNKAETAEKYGEKQVHIWRRSYDVRPPVIDRSDDRFPGHDARYRDIPEADIPTGESLKDTIDRVIPYYEEVIAPVIASGKRVIVAAHGNSIRGLVKYLDGISDSDIVSLEIPTGVPLIYEMEAGKPVRRYSLDVSTGTG